MNKKIRLLYLSTMFLALSVYSMADTFDSAVTIEPSYFGPKLILNDSNTSNKVSIEIRSNNVTKWEIGQSPSGEGNDLVFWRHNESPSRVLTLDHSTGFVGVGEASPTSRFHVYNGNIGITRNDGNPSFILDGGQGDIQFKEQGVLSGLLRFDSDEEGGTFQIQDRVNNAKVRLHVAGSGNIGIGTITPSHKLAVSGTIRAKEVILDTDWSDIVFQSGYELRTLDAVESHIEKHRRLPDVPSAAAVKSNGLSVGEAQKIMMQKIEELTLYVIELKKENEVQQREIEKLKTN